MKSFSEHPLFQSSLWARQPSQAPATEEAQLAETRIAKVLYCCNVHSYTGESYDSEAMIILSFYQGEAAAPKFWFIKDGLNEEKC